MKRIAVVLIALFALTGCSAELDSRGGQRFDPTGQNDADEVVDMHHVVTVRNVRNAPNIIISCYEDIAWVSGTTGTGSAQFTRATEYDDICEGKRYGEDS